MPRILVALIFLLSTHQLMLAQVNIRIDTMTYSIEELVRDVLIQSECAEISNVQFSGQDGQIGYFDQGSSAIDVKKGIILSTGNVFDASGPNISTSTSSDFFDGSAGDIDLSRVANKGINEIYDDVFLEFDFVPLNDMLEFQFIFASEEYCDFAGASTIKNDVFGFFLSGPGLSGPYENDAVNIGNLPGSGDNITIQKINHNNNYEYYIDNTPKDQPLALPEHYDNCRLMEPRDGMVSLLERDGSSVDYLEYDGYTVVLTASSPVTPFERYHLKIGIADVGDGVWDSAVFLKAGSFLAGQPLAEIEDPAILDCHTATVTLDAGASSSGSQFTHTWQTSDGHIVSGGNTLFPVIDEPGTYTLIVSRINGSCSDTSEVEVYFDGVRPEILDAHSPQLSCDSQSVAITFAIDQPDQFTYEVEYPNGTFSPVSNLPFVTTSMAGEHVLYARASNGCVDTRMHQVEIDTFAGSYLPDTYTFTCNDDSLFIHPSFDTQSLPFDFEWRTSDGLIFSPIDQLDLVVGRHGTYTLQSYNHSNGCRKEFVVHVVDDRLPPTISAGPDEQMNCDGEAIIPASFLVNATGEETIYWEVVQGGDLLPGVDLLHPVIPSPGTYVLVVTGKNGCISTDTLVVSPADEAPEILLLQKDSLTCLSEAARIAIDIIGDYETINWSGPFGGIIDQSPDQRTIGVLLPGLYEITVENLFGCQSSIIIEIKQGAWPVANAGNDVALDCKGQRTLRAGSVDASSHINYQWTDLQTNTVFVESSQAVVSEEGLYLLTVSNLATGCISYDTVEVFPAIDAIDYVFEYSDCSFDMGLFYVADEDQQYIHAIKYRQNTYLPNATIAVVGSDPILLQLGDDCFQEIDIEYMVADGLQASIDVPNDVIAGSSFDLSTTINRNLWEIETIQWLAGDPPCLTCANQTITISELTTFELFISDIYGCETIVQLTVHPEIIYKVFVPSAFSPNEDRINDELAVFPNDHVASIHSMTVYDRWGEVVFQRNSDTDTPMGPEDFNWDGISPTGKESPMGVYVYDLMFTSIEGEMIHQTGSVTLIR